MIQPPLAQEAGDGPRSGSVSTSMPGPPPRRRRWLRALLGMVLIFGALFAATIAYMAATGPDVSVLARQNPESTAYIDLYRQQFPSGPFAWTWTPLDRISPHLRRAVLVGEDHLFYQHGGIVWSVIPTAIADSLSLGEGPKGVSTITQQT